MNARGGRPLFGEGGALQGMRIGAATSSKKDSFTPLLTRAKARQRAIAGPQRGACQGVRDESKHTPWRLGVAAAGSAVEFGLVRAKLAGVVPVTGRGEAKPDAVSKVTVLHRGFLRILLTRVDDVDDGSQSPATPAIP